MSPDNVQNLIDAAELLRDSNHEHSPYSLALLSASQELTSLRNRVAELEKVTPLHRIARAVELAATWGWGEVHREDLLPD